MRLSRRHEYLASSAPLPPLSAGALLRSGTFIVLAVIAVLFFVWRLQIVPVGDDFVYSHTVTGDSDSFFEVQGDPVESWSDVGVAAIRHWLAVNGRLANILTFAVLHLPVWAGATLCSLAWLAMMLLVMALGCGRRAVRCAALTAAMALIGWKWYPWTDSMALTCYFINYGWTCVAALGFVLLFRSGRLPALCMAAAFITGWMHELFGLALLAGYALLLLTGRRYDRRQWWALCALLLGTALSALAPSTFMRIDAQMGGGGGMHPGAIAVKAINTLLHCWPVYVYLLAASTAAITRGWRCVRKSIVANMLWWVVLAASVVAVAALDGGPRMMWLADAGIMIALLELLAEAFPALTRPHRVTAALLTLLSCLLLGGVAYQQREFSKVFMQYREAARAHDLPWIIRNVNDDPQQQWWALDIPSCPGPATVWYYADASIPRMERGYDDTNFFVTPAAADTLRPSFADLPPLSSDGTIRGVWPWVYSQAPLEPDRLLRLRLGAPLKRMPPYARIFDNGAGESSATVVRTHPVWTPAGERIYILTLAADRAAAMHEVLAVNP